MAVIAKAVLIVVAVKTVIMHISIVTVTINVVWMLMMSMITSPNYRNLSYAS